MDRLPILATKSKDFEAIPKCLNEGVPDMNQSKGFFYRMVIKTGLYPLFTLIGAEI